MGLRNSGLGRIKVWNEHVKLFATLINAVAIGILAVAVIGPLAQPDNPFYGWGDLSVDKLKGTGIKFIEPSIFDVIEWTAIGVAILVHLAAHLALRMQRDE